MPEHQRELTEKEKLVILSYESARPGLGEVAEKNIRNSDTGWADIIKNTDESELTQTEEKTSSNSFIYKRIGG